MFVSAPFVPNWSFA